MYHQRSNYVTRDNIEYLLSQQTVKRWKLGDCDFERYFHYKWENENGLLGPLFSIAEPFDIPYVWTFDTTTYPWTLNLETPSEDVEAYVRYGKNLADIEREIDPSNIVNKLYALGNGEGVNQLTFRKLNEGLPYISDDDSIAEYGLQQYVWVDRRFEVEESLLSTARAFLNEWSTPKVTYKVSAIDLTSLTGLSIDSLTVGKVIRVDDPDVGTVDLRIVSERKQDLNGKHYAVDLELSNTASNVGTTLADVERRQQINEVYSQGSTNILNFTYQDNCDDKMPATIPFYIDDDVINVNTIELTFRTRKFRAYSRATLGGGALVKSTKGGGGITKSSASGGGSTETTTEGGSVSKSTQSGGSVSKSTLGGGSVNKSTLSGGGVSKSSGQSNGWETSILPLLTGKPITNAPFEEHIHGLTLDLAKLDHWHEMVIPAHTHNFTVAAHTHEFTVPAHTHDFTIPAHSHQVTLKAHSHDITLPDHTHDIELPDHIHEVEHKIVELDELPTSVSISVGGNVVDFNGTTGDRFDLIEYLPKDSDGRVVRGRHEVTILPDSMARIEADLILRVFIQSHIGGNY